MFSRTAHTTTLMSSAPIPPRTPPPPPPPIDLSRLSAERQQSSPPSPFGRQRRCRVLRECGKRMRVPESHRGARSNVEEEGGWYGRVIGRRDPNVRRDIILFASIVAVCLLFGYSSSFRNTSIATTTSVRRAVGRSGDDDDNVADSQIQNISSLDDASSVHHPPLIIDVAAGSTGTRTLYKILCKLGFVGVHHRCYCNAFLEPVLRDMLYPISGSHAINKDGSQSMESETFYGASTTLCLVPLNVCSSRSGKLR